MINLQKLMDDAQGDETVRERRWPEGGCCPHCDSIEVTQQGRDTAQPAAAAVPLQGW